MKSLEQYRRELKGWKLTALRLTANGRFKGYEAGFLKWLRELEDDLKDRSVTAAAIRELDEAKVRVVAGNDDLFSEVCFRLEQALNLAERVTFGVDRGLVQKFIQACNTSGVDPGKKISDLIAVYLEEKT